MISLQMMADFTMPDSSRFLIFIFYLFERLQGRHRGGGAHGPLLRLDAAEPPPAAQGADTQRAPRGVAPRAARRLQPSGLAPGPQGALSGGLPDGRDRASNDRHKTTAPPHNRPAPIPDNCSERPSRTAAPDRLRPPVLTAVLNVRRPTWRLGEPGNHPELPATDGKIQHPTGPHKKTSDPKRSDVFLCFRVSQRKEGLHFQAAPRLYY